jgi:hypothetical protein
MQELYACLAKRVNQPPRGSRGKVSSGCACSTAWLLIEVFLRLAGRERRVAEKKLVDMGEKLRDTLKLIETLLDKSDRAEPTLGRQPLALTTQVPFINHPYSGLEAPPASARAARNPVSNVPNLEIGRVRFSLGR